jgi:hypothetical protein
MKIKHLLVFSLLSFFVSFGLNAFGDDGHTEEQNKAVKEFVVEGIGLGATYSEIKAKYPDIEFMKEDSDAKVGLAVWRTFSTKKVDAVRFYIFNGKTYKISIFYTAETLSKFGGYETIYQKLVAKYGKEDESSPDEKSLCDYTWQFFDANRYINYNVVKENSCGFVIVVDKELSRQLSEKRKSQADVGF